MASYDPEGLIFAAGVDSRQLKLYDLRTFDKVCKICHISYLGIIIALFAVSMATWSGAMVPFLVLR